jgi:hypothetical protein
MAMLDDEQIIFRPTFPSLLFLFIVQVSPYFREKRDGWLANVSRKKLRGGRHRDHRALRRTPFWHMLPITYRVSHEKILLRKKTANPPEVACLCLSSVCKRSSFLFRYLLFYSAAADLAFDALVYCWSLSADYGHPGSRRTRQRNQIKLYSAHLFCTQITYLSSCGRNSGKRPLPLGILPHQQRNPSILGYGGGLIAFQDRIFSLILSVFFFSFIPHAASFFCYRSVGLKCFIRLADEAWRLKISKNSIFRGGEMAGRSRVPAGDSACYSAQNGRHNKNGHLTRNK